MIINHHSFIGTLHKSLEGGGRTPYNALHGEAWSKRESFYRCQVYRNLACRTGGLAGPAQYTKAHPKRKNKREALSQNHPPVVTPLFMLFQPFAWRMVCADWLLYITWSSKVFFPRCNTITYSDFESTTDRFAVKLFAEFNWKYGPISIF